MPLYEYECFLCHHRFERIQRVSDEPLTECPACGGAVRRLLGVPALQFKGSGFYITDYGKGDGTASKATATEESSTPSSDTKSESKGETKKPAKSAGTGASKKSE